MFCGKLRQEHQALQARLAQADREIAALRNNLSRLENERNTVRAELEGVQAGHQASVRLYANMQGFGDSFVALQKSQAAAAQALREEKQHAIEAASVSAGNREAVLQIAQSLDALSGDTMQTFAKCAKPDRTRGANRQHRSVDQGNCRPDQPAGAQCGD